MILFINLKFEILRTNRAVRNRLTFYFKYAKFMAATRDKDNGQTSKRIFRFR